MLDIDAISQALRQGSLEFLRRLRLQPFETGSHDIVSFHDDDAVVFPLAASGTKPTHALRLPLDERSSRDWPAIYADIAAVSGTIEEHLPRELTILDVEELPGVHAALLYDWVPGETLTLRVTRAGARGERDQLPDLLGPLADIAEALRLSGMVHGDLAPGNIVVRPDGGMTLLDLDRMDFRDRLDRMTPRRRPGYRIPRGGGGPVEEDAFGLLVMMTSIAIRSDASLPPDHEKAPDASHPSLVFSTWDLMDPRRSRLVREIEGELTALSGGLLEHLIQACSGSSDDIPGLLREAVRLIRRSVSPPDAGNDAIPSQVDWQLVDVPMSAETSASAEQGHADGAEDESDAGWGRPRSESRWGRSDWGDEPAVKSAVSTRWDDDPGDWGRSTSAARATQSHWPAAAEPATSSWDVPIEPQPTAPPAPQAQEQVPVDTPMVTVDRSTDVQDIIDQLKALAEAGVPFARNERRSRRSQKRQRRVSTQLQEALAHNDRASLIRLAMSGSLAEMERSSRSDLLQVVRALNHDAIDRAVKSDDDGMILAAVDETLFEQDSDLDPAFRDRVRVARSRIRWTDQLEAAVRDGDAGAVSSLMDEPPDGAVDRLPEPMRRHVSQMMDRDAATRDALDAMGAENAEGLAQALGRLVEASPVWTDHVDADRVLELLGVEQLVEQLTLRLERGSVKPADQWVVDLVVASGMLPEATRRAVLTPSEVDVLINGEWSEEAD